jgi:hypothetical protein
MIGHYLLTLCPEAEDAILTGRLEPGSYGIEDVRCLVGWACDVTEDRSPFGSALGGYRPWHADTSWRSGEAVENRFDNLCIRFGTERIGRVIRERILANRARRELQQPVVYVDAVYGG